MALQKDNLRVNMGYGPEDVIIAIVGSQFLYKGLWLGHAIVLRALEPLLADFPLNKEKYDIYLKSHSVIICQFLTMNNDSKLCTGIIFV